jgi:hypothetical protein
MPLVRLLPWAGNPKTQVRTGQNTRAAASDQAAASPEGS